MDSLTNCSPRFGPEADEELTRFYQEKGADGIEEKISALEAEVGEADFYAFGGEVDAKMKLGCLEYEYLTLRGIIELEYV